MVYEYFRVYNEYYRAIKSLIWSIQINAFIFIACPDSYPWAWNSGRQCCKYNMTCNGDPLSTSSSCCKDGESKECTSDAICEDAPSM